MAYYPDLSPYTYTRLWGGPPVFNIGWLDAEHTYSQETVPDSFLERLWAFCCHPGFRSGGYHGCEFCQALWFPINEQRGDETCKLSAAEIRVLSGDGQVAYAAPDLIYHYVVAHHYCPPEEFIQAVMETPLPGTPEYEVLKKEKWLSEEVEFEWILRGRHQR